VHGFGGHRKIPQLEGIEEAKKHKGKAQTNSAQQEGSFVNLPLRFFASSAAFR
jgi:hypothetical protein